MPAGYSARCKVCNSGHRTEIERWIREEGLSPRQASQKLKDEYQESISHKSIWRHMNEHFDVKAEARKQYQKSQQQIKEQAQKRLSEIEILDNIIAGDYELHQGVRQWLADLVTEKKRIPLALVQLLTATASEVRQHMKQKQAMLGEDPASKIAEVLSDLWEEDEDES